MYVLNDVFLGFICFAREKKNNIPDFLNQQYINIQTCTESSSFIKDTQYTQTTLTCPLLLSGTVPCSFMFPFIFFLSISLSLSLSLSLSMSIYRIHLCHCLGPCPCLFHVHIDVDVFLSMSIFMFMYMYRNIYKFVFLMFMFIYMYTLNPPLLTSSFVWLFLHISFFKVIIRKYFTQSKCELLNFLFVLLEKIKMFTL